MGESIISGDSQWSTLSSESGTFVVRDLTITAAKEIGIFARNSNAVFENIEVDGSNWGVSSDPGDAVFIGVGVANLFSENTTANLRNIYVHDFNVDSNQFMGVAIIGGDTGDVDLSASNVTISDIANTNSSFAMVLGSGLFTGGSSSGTVSGHTNNLTVANNTSTNQVAAGYVQTMITQGTNELNTSLSNSTFANIQSGGASPIFGTGGAISVFAAAGVRSDMTLTTSNLLLAPGSVGCKASDVGAGIDANTFTGSVTNTIVSHGGNLSEDGSCTSYFTHETDQNNLSNLASTLDPIGYNGGFIPTIALKQASPAVDSGVNVAGLATDARGAIRPQGSAFDSGAYESSYSKPPTASLAGTGDNLSLYALLTALMGLAGIATFYIQRRMLQ